MVSKTAQDLDPTLLPVLWLLGKTGAGKTSIVRALTGAGAVGSGFAPGTRSAAVYDFPANEPAVRFLDTRGLGEAGYDFADDLTGAEALAQAVLAVIRYDDPVQAPVLEAVQKVKAPVLLVYTGADLLPDANAQERVRAQIRKALGRDLPFVSMALPAEGMVSGVEALLDALDSFMPKAAATLRRADEARDFIRHRPMVLRYAGIAGASDVAPLIGAMAVPAAQGALLQALAKRHEITLSPARLSVLASALGTGVLVRYAASHMLRQGAKMVPVAGQTLGAAAAAGASFATTYALGRAASAWMYGTARGAVPDQATLRGLYDQALRGARDERAE
ncbi:kinase [Pararhodobacter oceanensis]|uniref:Kinase n=1 Tax=Pararhodobacter oceanensis TaxID=2172121 RepID=A0A2T8HVF9_9RHOB|nr:kinase [Pararhodobacter oceanensis]